MGAFMIMFFRDWGGLTQFQTQFLQSWFAFWIVILEIPTGVFGDVKGRKFSVLVGTLFSAIGFFLYGTTAVFWIFMLSEFVIAIGMAFCSGAQEALLYDTVKGKGLKDQYHKINVIDSNMSLFGMLAGAFVSGFVIKLVVVNRLVQLNALMLVIGFVLIYLFVKEPKIDTMRTLSRITKAL